MLGSTHFRIGFLSGLLTLICILLMHAPNAHAGDSLQKISVPNSGFETEQTLFVYASTSAKLTAHVDDAQFYRLADYNFLLNPGFEEAALGTMLPAGWSHYQNTQPINTESYTNTTLRQVLSHPLDSFQASITSYGIWNPMAEKYTERHQGLMIRTGARFLFVLS